MKIAIIGATGHIGSRILDEALRRGHAVTGLSRDASKFAARDQLTPRTADTGDPEALARALAGHDAVIAAVKWNENDIDKVLDAIRKSGVARALFVVGAGSLRRADGRLHFDHMKEERGVEPPTSKAAMAALQVLRGALDLDWTAVSPAAQIEPGERTGRFRLGLDQLIEDAQGRSRISTEDFAIAVLDEIETPRHPRRRFTLGY